MNIAILLPYKENFSKNETGTVSIFVNGINKSSKYNDNILFRIWKKFRYKYR